MNTKKAFNINGYKVTCRKCKRSDRDFVLNLLRETIFPYVSEYFEPSIEMFDERFYSDYPEKKILLRGQRRIGMFQLSEGNQRLVITGLFLHPQYQGKGIAKHLMRYFEKIAIRKGYNKIELLVWDNNPAQHFYEKLGYEKMSHQKHKFLMGRAI